MENADKLRIAYELKQAEEAAYIRALEEVRVVCAKHAMSYRNEAKRFGLSGNYGTAQSMQMLAESYGMICLEIGRKIGLDEKSSLRVTE